MRTDGESVTIDGTTWKVARISPGLMAKAADEFRGIEFQNGDTLRRLELKSSELPSVDEFIQMHRSVLVTMFKRSQEVTP